MRPQLEDYWILDTAKAVCCQDKYLLEKQLNKSHTVFLADRDMNVPKMFLNYSKVTRHSKVVEA